MSRGRAATASPDRPSLYGPGDGLDGADFALERGGRGQLADLAGDAVPAQHRGFVVAVVDRVPAATPRRQCRTP